MSIQNYTIKEIGEELKKEKDLKKREQLVILLKSKFNEDKSKFESIEIIINLLNKKNEFVSVKLEALDFVQEIGLMIVIYPNFPKGLKEIIIDILNDNPKKNPQFQQKIIDIFTQYLLKLNDYENSNNPNFSQYVEQIYILIENGLKIPDYINDEKIIIKYLYFLNRLLVYSNLWDSKYQISKYNRLYFWSKIDSYLLSFLTYKNNNIRKDSAELFQSYGTDKGEKEFQQAIIIESNQTVKEAMLGALAAIATTKESYFVFMYVMQKGTNQEKEKAREFFIKYTQNLGYNSINDMKSDLLPKKFQTMEVISIIGSFFSLSVNILTIASIMKLLSVQKPILWIALVLSFIGIATFISPIIQRFIQKCKYSHKLKKWKIISID